MLGENYISSGSSATHEFFNGMLLTEVSCQIAGRQQQRHDTVCFHNGNVPKCDISERVEKIRSPFYRADGTGRE